MLFKRKTHEAELHESPEKQEKRKSLHGIEGTLVELERVYAENSKILREAMTPQDLQEAYKMQLITKKTLDDQIDLYNQINQWNQMNKPVIEAAKKMMCDLENDLKSMK